MKVTSLSECPEYPCVLVELKSCKILIDVPVDLNKCFDCKPMPLTKSSRLEHNTTFPIRLPRLDEVYLPTVDIILISNVEALLGLPWLYYSDCFYGQIIATEPTKELGMMRLKELIAWFEHVDMDDELSGDFAKEYLHFLHDRREDIFDDLRERIEVVSFTEPTTLFNDVSITPFPSGYTIGSCNWLLETISSVTPKKVGFFSKHSMTATHAKAINLSSFEGCDYLIMPTTPISHPEKDDRYETTRQISEIMRISETTLLTGNMCIFPVSSFDVIFDLLEYLAACLDRNSLTHVPIYYVSTVAHDALSLSNIFVEWLSAPKQTKADFPSNPFVHADLVDAGRLRSADSVFAAAGGRESSPFAPPAASIVLCGDSTCRFGDVVHLIENFCCASNAGTPSLIFTDHRYRDVAKILSPYESFIKANTYYCPLSIAPNIRSTAKMLEVLLPKTLCIVQHQTNGCVGSEPQVNMLDVLEGNETLKDIEVVTAVPFRRTKLSSKEEKVNKLRDVVLSEDLVNQFMPMNVKNLRSSKDAKATLAICNAFVDVKDGVVTLTSAEEALEGDKLSANYFHPPQHYLLGSPNVDDLLQELKDEGFADVALEEEGSGPDRVKTIFLKKVKCFIKIEKRKTHIISIVNDESVRRKITKCVNKCTPVLY